MRPFTASARRWFAVALTTGLLSGFGQAVMAQESGATARAPMPATVFKGKGDECVRETDFMRRKHMTLILHQRDDTVHDGIRTRQYSLKNCINCHADPQTNSVLGENGFCQSCHSYASVTMDCFSCHSAAPEKDVEPSLTRAPGPNPHIKEQLGFRPVTALTETETLELVNSSTARPAKHNREVVQ